METTVLYLCGFWFWLTRKHRVAAYSDAARQLELARRYLSQDFNSRASTCDRGRMLPQQLEALALLDHHAEQTLATASRFHNLIACCRFVAGELREATNASPIRNSVPTSPVLLPQPAPIRVRITFAPARFLHVRVPTTIHVSGMSSLLRREGSGATWYARGFRPGKLRHVEPTVDAETYEPQQLKAA